MIEVEGLLPDHFPLGSILPLVFFNFRYFNRLIPACTKLKHCLYFYQIIQCHNDLIWFKGLPIIYIKYTSLLGFCKMTDTSKRAKSQKSSFQIYLRLQFLAVPKKDLWLFCCPYSRVHKNHKKICTAVGYILHWFGYKWTNYKETEFNVMIWGLLDVETVEMLNFPILKSKHFFLISLSFFVFRPIQQVTRINTLSMGCPPPAHQCRHQCSTFSPDKVT